jgi:hypothetical protein
MTQREKNKSLERLKNERKKEHPQSTCKKAKIKFRKPRSRLNLRVMVQKVKENNHQKVNFLV